MSRVKKVLEIMALPLVLVLGYSMTAMILLLVASAVATYMGCLIGLNLEEPKGYVVMLDILTLAGLLLILRAGRVRDGAAEIWKQLRRNL